ncbi:sulfotransferase [Rubrobacter taiwanensis]|uniref:Sulfotransferase n=1 Tax=Rubrobacter taiwanensis TaxID=185139 RepID=A0A4R1BDY1_9ACTN|nr:sulfotransferase [Rubrobacter taiwanensis]TCJ15264.1 sulfotransferase [Rubrobacter taiwanensis]
MTLPDFLIIGAQKAGTTALYRYLSRHPEIYMSPIKEPHFFAFEGREPDYRGPRDAEILRHMVVSDPGEYRALFDEASGERALGEASAMYLYLPGTAERIKRHVPEVRLIAVLRDPAERAYSAFTHMVRDGREPEPDFARALELEEERIRLSWGPIWHYRRAGYYHEQLSRYYALFDPAQIRVYLYEDLDRDASGTLRDIFGFLGVDENHAVDTSGRYNVSGVPRSRTLHALHDFLLRPNRFKAALRPLFPKRLRRRLVEGALERIRSRNLEKPPFPPEVRRDLVAGYREDILRLEELIGRDLSGWLR